MAKIDVAMEMESTGEIVFHDLARASGIHFHFDMRQMELYKKAQEMDKNQEQFYLEAAGQAGPEHQKRMFGKLAREQKKHHFLLENVVGMVSNPDRWLEHSEFSRLEVYSYGGH